MTASTVSIRLGVEGQQQVSQALAGVEQRLDGMQGAVKKASHYGAALGLALGTDLVGRVASLGRSAVQAADDISVMASRLRLLGGTAASVADLQDKIFGVAQASRVSFTELGDTYSRIARAAQNLGVSQAESLAVTRAVGQAMALSGGSAQGLNAALVQLGQGLSAGTLRGEELNSIMEQAPRLAQALAEGLGVPIGRLRALGEQGKLTATAVFEALQKSAPKLAEELGKSTLTVNQSMTVLSNSTVRFVGDVDKATGASRLAATAVTGLASGLDAIGSAVRSNEKALQLIFGAGAAVAAAVSLGAAANALARIGPVVVGLGAVLAANPAVAALLGLAAVAGAGVGVMAIRAQEMESLAGKVRELDRLERDLARTQGAGFAETKGGGGKSLNDSRRERIAKLKDEIDAARLALRDDARRSELSDRNGVPGGPFPDAKGLDEVAKLAKLDLDIRKDYLDQRVQIAKAYAQAINQEPTAERRDTLNVEMQRRLQENSAQQAAALRSDAAAKSAEGRAAAQAQARRDLQVEENNADERLRAAKREREALDADREAGLVSITQYSQRKTALEERILADELRLADARIRAEQRTPAAPGAGGRLAKEAALLSLQSQRAAIAERNPQGDAEAEFARADQAQMQRVLEENVQRIRQARDAAAESAFDLVQANREANLALIRDDRERGEKQIALFKEQAEARIAAIDPLKAAAAQEAVNEAVALKTKELNQRLRPEWQRLLEDWSDTTKLMASAVDNSITGAMKSAEDAFVSLATTGKLNIKSLVNSIIADFARVQARQGIAALLKLGLSYFNTNIPAGNGVTPGVDGGNFARGGAFTNALVSTPTVFRFAQGGALRNGLMGEAGPEAIMPLTRDSAGRLGVRAQGGGGGGAAPINIVVNGDATPGTVRMIEEALAKYDRQRRRMGRDS